jgi:uncharacterized protein
MKNIVGRNIEKEKLKEITESKKSEFVAIYGRRRVGKTYLIREYYNNKFSFYITGIKNATVKEQLFNFYNSIQKSFDLDIDELPNNWQEAFHQLTIGLEKSKVRKKIIFIDELPWLASSKSNFLNALNHFWNHWASARKDIILIVCGSAAAWMINKIVKDTGGLHNRITEKIKINPFSLQETELFLKNKKIALNRHQIIELQMIYGGIPYYLETVKKGISVAQNIDESCFDRNGILHDEFNNLYASLFKNHLNHIQVIEALSSKNIGLSRDSILKAIKINDGGSFTKILEELEESGFIRKYNYFGKIKRDVLYQLVDFFSLFHFNFLKNNLQKNYWTNSIDNPKHRSWSGYAFELLCLTHDKQIKKALGISAVHTNVSSWKSKNNEQNVQIDLLFERRDQVITICEMKYSINKFTIDKKYSENLRNKIGVFIEESKTKYAVHLAMITTYGVNENQNYFDLVQNNITMDSLFD